MVVKLNLGQKKKIDGNIKSDTSDEHVSIGYLSTSEKEIEISTDGSISRRKLKVSQRAREFLASYGNKDQAQQASSILNVIDSILENFSDVEVPEIGIFVDDKDSLCLQWDVGDSTLGFGFEPDASDSYWIMLSGVDDRDVRAKGNLDNFRLLLPGLINIIKKMAIRNKT